MYVNQQVQEPVDAEPGPSRGFRNLINTEVLCNPEGAVDGSSAWVNLLLTCSSFPGNLGIRNLFYDLRYFLPLSLKKINFMMTVLTISLVFPPQLAHDGSSLDSQSSDQSGPESSPYSESQLDGHQVT